MRIKNVSNGTVTISDLPGQQSGQGLTLHTGGEITLFNEDAEKSIQLQSFIDASPQIIQVLDQSLEPTDGSSVADTDHVAAAAATATAQADATQAIADALAAQTTADLAQPLAEKDQNNGYAGLDAGGKLAPAQMPPLAITDTFVVADQAERLALTAETGDVAIQQDLPDTFILKGSDPSVNGNWEVLQKPLVGIQSIGVVAPIASTGGQTPELSISAASAGADGSMSKEDKSKLDGIELLAKDDQTGAEIKAAYEVVANAFTDALKTAYDAEIGANAAAGVADGKAVAAQGTADTAETNAQTGITNAATADGKAVTALADAATADAKAVTADGKAVAAQGTADTAETNAQTGITNAATADAKAVAAQATADAAAISQSAISAGDASSAAAQNGSQDSTTPASAQTASYVQADVESIRTMANALQGSYNQLQADFSSLHGKYAEVVALVNELKSNQDAQNA